MKGKTKRPLSGRFFTTIDVRQGRRHQPRFLGTSATKFFTVANSCDEITEPSTRRAQNLDVFPPSKSSARCGGPFRKSRRCDQAIPRVQNKARRPLGLRAQGWVGTVIGLRPGYSSVFGALALRVRFLGAASEAASSAAGADAGASSATTSASAGAAASKTFSGFGVSIHSM